LSKTMAPAIPCGRAAADWGLSTLLHPKNFSIQYQGLIDSAGPVWEIGRGRQKFSSCLQGGKDLYCRGAGKFQKHFRRLLWQRNSTSGNFWKKEGIKYQ
jgi:hypothetical protein